MVSDNEKAYAYLNLYDRNASQRITYDSGRDKRLNITCNLQAGEYYVTVNCSDSMGYVLDNEFEAQAIANDSENVGTYQSANKISFGQTKTGHLGYISDTNEKDESDWYVFNLNSQDEVNIGLVGNTNAYMYLNLYDENGDKRIKYDSGRDKKLNVTNELEAGMYYIKVESSEAVGYTLTLNNASGDVDTDSERVTAAPAATEKPAKVTEAPTATVKPAKTTQVPVPTTTKEPIKPASSVVVKDSLNVKQNSNKRLALDINGKSINFSDALPFIDGNGRTQIPIRAVAEAMGCTVDWNDSTKTVTITKDSTVIRLSINSLYIQVGNVTVTMDTTAQIVNDRTYIPIRFVGEALGMDVNWISSADTGL
ncbi:MAG: stalk domain-containing protein, partial [Eubacterium sp.]